MSQYVDSVVPTARLVYSVPMNTAAVTGLWIVALGAAYLTLAPVLDFFQSTLTSPLLP